jgi:hypothetical protein
VLDGGAVEGASGAGDDDHVMPPLRYQWYDKDDIKGNSTLAIFCYHR